MVAAISLDANPIVNRLEKEYFLALVKGRNYFSSYGDWIVFVNETRARFVPAINCAKKIERMSRISILAREIDAIFNNKRMTLLEAADGKLADADGNCYTRYYSRGQKCRLCNEYLNGHLFYHTVNYYSQYNCSNCVEVL